MVILEEGSSIDVDGIKFELKQFHFHTPSENNINGTSFPLEAHFVHASKDGELAVVALMFEEGEENKILAKLWNKMPMKVGVRWIVLKKATTLSKAQQETFLKVLGHVNNRPIQNINARLIAE